MEHYSSLKDRDHLNQSKIINKNKRLRGGDFHDQKSNKTKSLNMADQEEHSSLKMAENSGSAYGALSFAQMCSVAKWNSPISSRSHGCSFALCIILMSMSSQKMIIVFLS